VNRPDSYNCFFTKHRPLVAREHRYEVHERMLATGDVLKPLQDEEIAEFAAVLKREAIEAGRGCCSCIATGTHRTSCAPSGSSKSFCRAFRHHIA